MTDKIDTSNLGRIDLASGKSPAPIEECVSTWAVDDLLERLRRHEPRTAYFATCRTAPVIKNEYEAPINPDGPEAADRIQSLIADNEQLRDDVQAIREALDWAANFDPVLVDQIRERALSHKDMT